ncbi:TlpA disulfide reductase family protein, partial [Arthrospira platensis SPKY1]|nr:TlpA disulfide reductase family protein [Arthrospira platensis SPKY1]
MYTLITATAIICLFANAQGIAENLGGAAPALNVSEFIKGDVADVTDGGIYVVEFWATWCPPCRASIPHLTELQKKFKDKGVTFIGISQEDSAEVKPFVESMGDAMQYTVAVD